MKIGDKVRYKNFTNITGTITEEDKPTNCWVINGALLATENEIELDKEPEFSPWIPQSRKCTCGSSSVGSDRHSDYCDRYVK